MEANVMGIEVEFETYEDIYQKDSTIRDERDISTFWKTRNDLIRDGLLTGDIDPEEEPSITVSDIVNPIIFKQLTLW